MRRVYTFLFIAALLGFSSCLDPINFESGDNDSILVVDGLFTTAENEHIINLSKSLPFGRKFRDPVNGAMINLHSADEKERYQELGEGKYLLSGNKIRGIVGKEYWISIELMDGGKYESTRSIMPKPQPLEKVYFEFDSAPVFQRSGVERDLPVVNIYVDTDLNIPPNESTYLRWSVAELFVYTDEICGALDITETCYVPVNNDKQDITLLDPTILNTPRIKRLKVATKFSFPLEEFKNRHYFSVSQISTSGQAFEYWSRIKDITELSGTVFDPPPASVRGNIFNPEDPQELVLGYFEVANVTIERTFIFPFQFQEAIDAKVHCNIFNRFAWPAACCSCLRLPNATLEVPEWLQ